MKRLIIVTRKEKLDAIKKIMQEKYSCGMTVTQVEGIGNQADFKDTEGVRLGRNNQLDIILMPKVRIEAVVMLGPPNRGSVLAYFGNSRAARGINASLADMTPSPDSYVRNIPPPPFLPPVGIVAGRFDGKVALSSTLLPDGQPCERIVVPCTHPGLRDPKHTLDPILRFLRAKSFSA